MDKALLQWISGNDTGLSSKAIFAHFMELDTPPRNYAPADPSDFGRCARLLELRPDWRLRISEMSKYSKDWAAISAHWEEVHNLMDGEVGIHWEKGERAIKTFARMSEIYKEA